MYNVFNYRKLFVCVRERNSLMNCSLERLVCGLAEASEHRWSIFSNYGPLLRKWQRRSSQYRRGSCPFTELRPRACTVKAVNCNWEQRTLVATSGGGGVHRCPSFSFPSSISDVDIATYTGIIRSTLSWVCAWIILSYVEIISGKFNYHRISFIPSINEHKFCKSF